MRAPAIRFVMVWLLVASAQALMPSVSASQEAYGYIDFSPSYREAAPGETLYLSVTGASSNGGAIMVSFPPSLILSGTPVCSGDCFGADVVQRPDATIIQAQIGLSVATIGFFVTIPAGTSPGASITVQATLTGGPRAITYATALIVVDERQPVPTAAIPSTTVQAYVRMTPDAVRISPNGEADFLVQSLFYGTEIPVIRDFVLEIQIPPSLHLTAGPFCEPRSSKPEKRVLCDRTEDEVGGGRKIYRIRPGQSESGADGVYFTVRPMDGADADFAQIIANIEPDPTSTWTTGATAYSNLVFIEEHDLFIGDSRVLGGVIEVTGNYRTSTSGCDNDQFYHGKQLLLIPWGQAGEPATITLSQGQQAESTSDAHTESCYFPFLAPGARQGQAYVISDGDCLRCGVGILLPNRLADPVLVVNPN